ncbi:tetratricopeptide repeat-containing sensor histidine kinase [Niabella insulamsoli]|uniref:tetratricopeptide repeat-containing sensor histidine kinase n=1 Tax=Niabella insulamsoli TaxID=3144874 RepID=UPI0031FBBE58
MASDQHAYALPIGRIGHILLLAAAGLLINLSCSGQQVQHEIDSLAVLLKQHPQKDTVRVALLTELAFSYHFVDPDKGLQMAQEAERLADKLQFSRGKAMACSRKGINYWAKGQDSLSMLETAKALRIYGELGDQLSYAKMLNNRAMNFFARGVYIDALRDHEEALGIFQSLNYINGIRHSYNNIGTVFMTINDYERAMDAYLSGFRVKGQEDKGMEAHLLNNIGLVLKNQRQYHKALVYEKRAARLYELQGNRRGQAQCYANMGSIYDLLKQPAQALKYYNRSLQINQQLNNLFGIASDKTNIGITLKDWGSAQASLVHLQEALQLYRELNDKGNQSLVFIALAAAKDSLSGDRNSKMKVLELQQNALKIAVESKIPLRESEASEAISHTYKSLKKYKEALQAYERHIILDRSIFNEEKAREITRKQVSFEFEKAQEAAYAEARRQKEMRNAAIIGGGGLLLAAIVGFAFYKRRKDLKAQKQEAEYRRLIAETELQVLRSQLNPHFIFNSLNSIGDYIGKRDRRESQNYLADFAQLMRMTLEYAYQAEISLREDLEFLKLYLDLEKKRLTARFDYHILVPDDIDQDNVLLPPLLFQPFIENSIKHGFSGLDANGLITITMHQKNEQLVCTVDDNGKGMRSLRRYGGRHPRGLSISKRRVTLFARQHKSTGEVKIVEKPETQGTLVVVTLPLVLRF